MPLPPSCLRPRYAKERKGRVSLCLKAVVEYFSNFPVKHLVVALWE